MTQKEKEEAKHISQRTLWAMGVKIQAEGSMPTS
jgi:hypothetical protein